MLKNWMMEEKPEENELKERLNAAREKLWAQQMRIKEHKLPVLVLMEGWGTAGKGSCTGQVIRNIDPRFFKVATLEKKTEEEKKKPILEGMEKVYKQLMTTLEEIGVKPIEAVGQEFNPDFHNAVMHVEDEELGENIIAEEFQKGYTYRDSVIRPSMVKVAN